MVDALMNCFLNSKVAKHRKGQATTLGSGTILRVSGRGSLALRVSWASPSLA